MSEVTFLQQNSQAFYSMVIADTIANLQEAFLSEGAELGGIKDLQQLWLAKMESELSPKQATQTNVISDPSTSFTAEANGLTFENEPVDDEAPSPGTHIPIMVQITGKEGPFEISLDVPCDYLLSNKLGVLLDNNIVSNLRHLEPEQATNVLQKYINECTETEQCDGNCNDSGSEEEGENNPRYITKSRRARGGGDSSSDSDISNIDTSFFEPDPDSNDDITDDESQEFETDNLVLCQFTQVKRQKNQWKFVFKNGIMCINGNEYFFHRATGEGTW